MKKLDLPVKEIVKKYKEGISQRELAEEYNVCKATISKKINKFYKEREEEIPTYETNRKRKNIEEIIKKYEEGVS